jgi:hypothetical protein
VEKVVKPPQNPTIKRKYNSDLSPLFFIAQPNKNPIRKQPIRFAKMVGHGNPPLVTVINFDMAKRKILPNPPPMNT